MTDSSHAAAGAYSLVAAQQLAAAQPTAAQIARFEAQLQLPQSTAQPAVAEYSTPLAAREAGQVDFRPALDYMSQVSSDYRKHFAQLPAPPASDLQFDSRASPELQATQALYRRIERNTYESLTKVQQMKMVELEFMCIGKQCELSMRNVQILYQPSG